MSLTKPKQHFRFEFHICINTINGVLVNNNDVLHVAWKTASHKGKLTTHTLKLENSAQTQPLTLWWQQQITFEDSLCLDVDSQSFDTNPLSFFLKREKTSMTETLGEFRTDLGLCANNILTENSFSVDVPSQKLNHLKANITVKFKLLEKSPIRKMETILNESAGVAGDIQELKQEMARVSNEYQVLKTIVIDSQSFSKSDYWVEKIPDMELSLREYTTKVDELNTYVHKILQDTKIIVLDDKITDLHSKLFSEQDKLRRLSDIYHAFTQSTTQEIAKLREKTEKSLSSSEVGEVMGGSVTPRSLGSKHLSLHMIPRISGLIPKAMLTPPVSPRAFMPDPLDISSTDITPDSTPMTSPALKSIHHPTTSSASMDADVRLKLAQLDELRIRLERIESDTQQLWPRLALDEAEAQQHHITTEALKWEREKDMENFYLFQKSQSQFAEELSKLKLQVTDFHSPPHKMEQRLELLESQMGNVKRTVNGMRAAAGGLVRDDSRSTSSPTLLNVDWRAKQIEKPRSPITRPQPSYAARGNSSWTPPYHWFLLDHCFLFASDGEPAGDLLVPAFFLVKFCTNSLDLADCKEDWSVFDGLFFALHFELMKHSKSPTHLLFWLANTSFILDQLNQGVFCNFKSRELAPSIAETARTVVGELESFVKNIYVMFAGFSAQVFETAVKSFSLCSTGDYENEWVKVVLAKLDWLDTLLRSYKLKDSFIQHVFGDMFAVMDATLFNLICSDSSLCTPARANQVKYFLSSLDNWACSDHPSNSKIFDRLCHVREAANLILGPKGNLRESSFRKSLFPHISDLQHKYLLTIFTPDSPAEKLPPTLLSYFSTQITCTPGHNELDQEAVLISYDLGAFFESPPAPSETAPTGRFSPPPVTDTCTQPGYAVVNDVMRDVEAILSCDAYAHWGYLARELQKWRKPTITLALNLNAPIPIDSPSPIGRRTSVQSDRLLPLPDLNVPSYLQDSLIPRGGGQPLHQQQPFGIEPLLTRCGRALQSVKLSPPPLRASSKARGDSSAKSIPLASYPQEEEAFERELELWICQNQQQMIQQGHAQPASSQHAHLTPLPSFFPSTSPTQTLSLPHPQQTRRKSTLHINDEGGQRSMHLSRQQSQPYPPPLNKSPYKASIMDMDVFDADFMLQDGAPVTLRAMPGSALYKPPSLNHTSLAPAITLPRSMTATSNILNSQTLPRKFPTIPAIKPISAEGAFEGSFIGRPNKNTPIPHIASAQRRSIIPDPEHETSALYSIDESGVEFVLGGTLPQLVNSLTDERADMDFIRDFLYTYRYFTTSDKFLELLQRRYIYMAPLICSPEERALFDDWRPPVQLRVINVLKQWIEDHFNDFDDPALLDKLRSFIFATISMENPKWATCLEEIIHARLICNINSGDKAIIPTGLDSLEVLCALLKQSELIKNRKWHLKLYRNCFVGQEAVDWMMNHMGLKSRQIVCNLGSRLVTQELIQCISKEKNEFRDTAHSFYQFTFKAEEILSRVLPATPILPKNNIEMNLANVAAKEIARQLTLIEFELFKRIKLQEISWQNWNKNKGVESPYVTAMIDRFNKVGFWVATEIVSQKHHTLRVALLKKLIKIAHQCKKINNFNTMMEIAVGLNMGSVSRLIKVWGALDTKTRNRFDEVMLLTHSSQNYKNYREALRTASMPALPYLALFLRDLTFIEDGNNNHMGTESEINFLKMRMLAKVFKSITQYQQCTSYLFTPVPQLQQYLLEDVEVLTEAELYKLSYQCEPARESTKLSSST